MLICIGLIGLSLATSLIILEILGIGWEIKDGLVPYGQMGKIDGFSWKDLIADNVGFLLGFLIASIAPI